MNASVEVPAEGASLGTRMEAALRSGGASFMPHRLPPDIEHLLAAMPDDSLPSLQATGTPATAVDVIRRGLLDAAFRTPSLADWLCSDIGELAAAFASAVGVAFVGVQLAPFITDHERRRADMGLGHRLVTTYRGSGTVSPNVLVFLPPRWPLSTAIGQQVAEWSPSGGRTAHRRLILAIDDHGTR